MALPLLALTAAGRVLAGRALGQAATNAARQALRAGASRGAMLAARRKPLPFLPPIWGDDLFDWPEEAPLASARGAWSEGALNYANTSGWVHRSGCAGDGALHTTASGVAVGCSPNSTLYVQNLDGSFPNGQHYKSGLYWYARTVAWHSHSPTAMLPNRHAFGYGNEYRMLASLNPLEPLPPPIPRTAPSSLPYWQGVTPEPFPSNKVYPPLIYPEVQQPIIGMPRPSPMPRYKDVPLIHAQPRTLPSQPVRYQPSAPAYSPALRPSQVPVLGRSETVVDASGTPRTIRTVAGGATPPPPHDLRPPRNNEREAKRRYRTTFAGFQKIVGPVTETVETITAIYNALPDRFKPRYNGTRFVKKSVTPQEKLQLIYRHWEHVDKKQAFSNYLKMQATDAVIGKLSKGVSKNQRNVFGDQLYTGWLTGSAL